MDGTQYPWTELMLAWSPLASVIIAPLIMWMTNRAKKIGVNPFMALALVSSFSSIAWLAGVGYYGEDVVKEWVDFAVRAGGVASVLYGLMKKYTE